MGIEISFSTGLLGGVSPVSIPARSQSWPQLETVSLIACGTSIVLPLASHRYSYLGIVGSSYDRL